MNIDFITWLFLSALASFRLAELFVIDDGPFDIFMNMRGWSASTNPLLRVVGQILTCVHCSGLYISAVLMIAYFWNNIYVFGFILAFACAGLQSILSNKLGRHS